MQNNSKDMNQHSSTQKTESQPIVTVDAAETDVRLQELCQIPLGQHALEIDQNSSFNTSFNQYNDCLCQQRLEKSRSNLQERDKAQACSKQLHYQLININDHFKDLAAKHSEVVGAAGRPD